MVRIRGVHTLQIETVGKKRPARFALIPSIADMFFVTILLLVFFSDKASLLGDGDTGYHVRAGEYIIRNLSIPKYDIFSLHTPPLPWTAHEWLSEVIMALVHSVAGLTGVVAFFSLLLALTGYLLFKMLRAHGADITLATAITLLAVASSRIHWLARPHVFSFLLMILTHYLLECWHRGRMNRLYLIPLIMLVWVNLHGGYLGGFILMGAYLVGNLASMMARMPEAREAYRKKLKELSLVSAASLAACLVNPRGYEILLFPFKLVSDKFLMDHVAEFLSPNFHEAMPFKYLLLLLIAVLAASRKPMEATELVLVLVFTNMALYSARYIPLFALVATPALTRQAEEASSAIGGRISSFIRKRSEHLSGIDSRSRGFFWPVAATLLIALAILSGRFPHYFDEKVKAVAACEFLMKEKIGGNMFNDDEFGDYLIYRGYPSYKVFFDGRSDMYGPAIMKEYYKVTNFEPGWEQVLQKYRVDWIFFDSNSRLSRFLLKDSNWVLIYSDKVADIFVRNIPRYHDLIARHRSVKQAIVKSEEI
jgi:hypothetical protein